jgi:hypothetical protein
MSFTKKYSAYHTRVALENIKKRIDTDLSVEQIFALLNKGSQRMLLLDILQVTENQADNSVYEDICNNIKYIIRDEWNENIMPTKIEDNILVVSDNMIIRVRNVISESFPVYKYTLFKDKEIAKILLNDSFMFIFSKDKNEFDNSFREYLYEELENIRNLRIEEQNNR